MKLEVFYNGEGEGDWTIASVDGKVVAQNHSLSLYDWENIFKALGQEAVFHTDLTDDEIVDVPGSRA